MTFLTILGVTKILCSFGLVLEGKEILESSGLEFLEKFLVNSFALSVFSLCNMAGEQSIALLVSEFKGREAQITHKFLTCFYCRIILSLGC